MSNYRVISEIETPLGYSIQVRQNNDFSFDVGHLSENGEFSVKHNNLSPIEVVNALSFYAQSAYYALGKSMSEDEVVKSDFMVEYENHPWLVTKSAVRDWVIENLSCDVNAKMVEGVDFTINKDLSVNLLADDVYIEKTLNGYLPIKIKEAKTLRSNDEELRSFIGSPERANLIDFQDCMISSFEGLSGNFDTVYVDNNSLYNFTKMSSDLKINELSLFQNPINSWDGMTLNGNINIRYWSNLFAEKQKMLLLETPKSINSIEVNWKLNFDASCPWLDMSGCYLDMDELKKDIYAHNNEKKAMRETNKKKI